MSRGLIGVRNISAGGERDGSATCVRAKEVGGERSVSSDRIADAPASSADAVVGHVLALEGVHVDKLGAQYNPAHWTAPILGVAREPNHRAHATNSL